MPYRIYDKTRHKWIDLSEVGTIRYFDDARKASQFESLVDAENLIRYRPLESRYWQIQEIGGGVIPIEDKPLENYYVTLRSAPNDYRRELRFSANSFSHAEEQAVQCVEQGEEIISIDLDYKV